jgi:hypothetical protein
VWQGDPIAIAQSWAGAVWPFSLPDGDRVAVMRALVDQATALGLVVFDDQLGMAFLPGGQVLPTEMASQWADLKRQLDDAPAPLTKAEVRQLMATYLREMLKKHGFVPRKSTRWDVEFVRPTRADAAGVLPAPRLARRRTACRAAGVPGHHAGRALTPVRRAVLRPRLGAPRVRATRAEPCVDADRGWGP